MIVILTVVIISTVLVIVKYSKKNNNKKNDKINRITSGLNFIQYGGLPHSYNTTLPTIQSTLTQPFMMSYPSYASYNPNYNNNWKQHQLYYPYYPNYYNVSIAMPNESKKPIETSNILKYFRYFYPFKPYMEYNQILSYLNK